MAKMQLNLINFEAQQDDDLKLIKSYNINESQSDMSVFKSFITPPQISQRQITDPESNNASTFFDHLNETTSIGAAVVVSQSPLEVYKSQDQFANRQSFGSKNEFKHINKPKTQLWNQNLNYSVVKSEISDQQIIGITQQNQYSQIESPITSMQHDRRKSNMEFAEAVIETFGESRSSAQQTPRIKSEFGNFVYTEDGNYQRINTNDDKLCYLCQRIFSSQTLSVFLKSNYFLSVLLFLQVICAANLIAQSPQINFDLVLVKSSSSGQKKYENENLPRQFKPNCNYETALLLLGMATGILFFHLIQSFIVPISKSKGFNQERFNHVFCNTALLIMIPCQIWRINLMWVMISRIYLFNKDHSKYLGPLDQEQQNILANQLHSYFKFHPSKAQSLVTEMTYLKHSLLLDLGWFGLISGIIIKILVSIWHLQIKSNQDTASSAELKSEEENDEYLLHQNNQIMRIYAYIFICVVLLKTFRPFLSQSDLSQFQNVSWYLQLIGCLVILFVAIRVVIEYQEGLKAEENKEEQQQLVLQNDGDMEALVSQSEYVELQSGTDTVTEHEINQSQRQSFNFHSGLTQRRYTQNQSFHNEINPEMPHSAFASQSFFNDQSSHLNQTNNSFNLHQTHSAVNDEALSALSSYYLKERGHMNDQSKKGVELPTEIVLMYLRAKHHQNEVENTKLIQQESEVQMNDEAQILYCDIQTKNVLRALAMILLISLYIQIICKNLKIKDSDAKQEFSSIAVIIGCLSGVLLSKCNCFKKQQRGQIQSSSDVIQGYLAAVKDQEKQDNKSAKIIVSHSLILALSFSFIFVFQRCKPSQIEHLHRIRCIFEVIILYSLSFILFEATKAQHQFKKLAYEKQFMLLVSKNEYSTYRYSPIPVSFETSSFTLFVNGVVIAISNMLIYGKIDPQIKLALFWLIFLTFFIDYQIRACIRYRQDIQLNQLFSKLKMQPAQAVNALQYQEKNGWNTEQHTEIGHAIKHLEQMIKMNDQQKKQNEKQKTVDICQILPQHQVEDFTAFLKERPRLSSQRSNMNVSEMSYKQSYQDGMSPGVIKSIEQNKLMRQRAQQSSGKVHGWSSHSKTNHNLRASATNQSIESSNPKQNKQQQYQLSVRKRNGHQESDIYKTLQTQQMHLQKYQIDNSNQKSQMYSIDQQDSDSIRAREYRPSVPPIQSKIDTDQASAWSASISAPRSNYQNMQDRNTYTPPTRNQQLPGSAYDDISDAEVSGLNSQSFFNSEYK